MSEPADLVVTPARPGLLQRVSVVWLVPVLALVVSLGVAWRSYSDRGSLIEITFANGSGIEAGQTVLKYRDVTVGKVETVGFGAGLSSVVVGVRVDGNVAPYLDEDATFWVVRPKVSVRGITGLNTVLSGVFIEGNWNTVAGASRRDFEGLADAPLVRQGQEGRRVTFRMRSGNQLAAGAPIIHKGIHVGYVEAPRLSPAGDAVLIDAFIEAPYDQRITTATKFWDTSGFSVNLGPGGLTLDVDSIASLVEGGISFDTLVSGGAAINDGHQFEVFDDERSARESVFEATGAENLQLSILFDGSINGLSVGAEVRFRGIRVGEVTDIGALVEDAGGRPFVRLLANVALRPGRLGLEPGAGPEAAMALLQSYVETGMRAQLATASILSGALIVNLVEIPDAVPARINMAGDPYPILPSVPAAISDFSATAEGVFERINALPVEELMTSAISLLDSLDVLANDPALRKTPDAALALLTDARTLLGSEAMTQLPEELRAAAVDLRAMLAGLSDGQAVANLLAAIDKANTILARVDTAAADLPEITRQLRLLGEKANGLAVEDLVNATTSLVRSADAFIGTDEARKLPPALTSALNEIAVFLGQVREGGAIESANAAISAAESAANAVANAADTLPGLSEKLSQLIGQASAVVGSYGEKSRLSAELLATLRDIQGAADAVTALARTIQRNPNSIILGR